MTKTKVNLGKQILFLLAIIITLPVFLVSFYMFVFIDRFYPNSFIADVDVSGLTKQEAVLKISDTKINSLIFSYNLDSKEISIQNLLKYDYVISVENAYNQEKPKFLFDQIMYILKNVNNKNTYPLAYSLHDEELLSEIYLFTGKIQKQAIAPSLTIENKALVYHKGEPGYVIDEDDLMSKTSGIISYNKDEIITLKTKLEDPSLSQEDEKIFIERGNNILGKSITLNLGGNSTYIPDTTLVTFLKPIDEINPEAVSEYVVDYSERNNRDNQNPIFNFTNGRVSEFSPGKTSIQIKNNELENSIIATLNELLESENNELSINVPHTSKDPDFTLENINNYGIKELIGVGTSKYAGSIASRVHNISVASRKFNGVLVAPGDTFSFNKTLGEVSSSTGYQQAYVIKDGATVLGDGGGVCQVSTTLFRAVMNAGLPIAERRAHSYRVGYYEQDSPPGLDATVYEPSPDFKFTNDTGHHILIQTMANSSASSLRFEIYGTKDGRVSSISKPVVSSVTPPPDDLYIDDATLPTGTIKQIDWKAWGAKVNFNYKVTRNGETIFEKTFYSNYQPWQAKFLRGTGSGV